MEEKVYLEVKKLRTGIGRVGWYILSVVILSFFAKEISSFGDSLADRFLEPFDPTKSFLLMLPFVVEFIIYIVEVILIVYTWFELRWLAKED